MKVNAINFTGKPLKVGGVYDVTMCKNSTFFNYHTICKIVSLSNDRVIVHCFNDEIDYQDVIYFNKFIGNDLNDLEIAFLIYNNDAIREVSLGVL